MKNQKLRRPRRFRSAGTEISAAEAISRPVAIARGRARRTRVGTFALSRALAVAAICTIPLPVEGQDHEDHDRIEASDSARAGGHRMLALALGGGWEMVGMAQAFPIMSIGLAPEGTALDRRGFFLTQPAAMLNLESAGGGFSARVTPNFEGIAIPDGELTFGGWGEGFLDSRHPHTLLHEAMVSLNARELGPFAGGSGSLSFGRGFAPYGTDDPMSRPVLKYPTNHHLSQILERWTLNAVYRTPGWSLEAGVFGGGEPTGPYDLGNIESFADSWSTRLTRRFGPDGSTPWEAGASYAVVREEHDGRKERTRLYNISLRHEAAVDFGGVYGLGEFSISEPEEGRGYWSLLGELAGDVGLHRPYVRMEYATRPEYDREGPPTTDGFFRYDHDEHAVGATRWLITSAGYGFRWAAGPLTNMNPFVELQHFRVAAERGGIEPEAIYGTGDFWSLSAGFRLFLGGGPMRMGSYGVLDPMTRMRWEMSEEGSEEGHDAMHH